MTKTEQEKKLRFVCERIMDAQKGRRSPPFFLFFAVGLALIALVGSRSGVLCRFISEDMQFLLVATPLVSVIAVVSFKAIWNSVDLVLVDRAISQLRVGNLTFAAFVIFDRPVRNRKLLRDPGLILVVAFILEKFGWQKESRELREDVATRAPAVASVWPSLGKRLTDGEMAILGAGVRGLHERNLFALSWRNRRARSFIVAGFSGVVLLYWLSILTGLWDGGW